MTKETFVNFSIVELEKELKDVQNQRDYLIRKTHENREKNNPELKVMISNLNKKEDDLLIEISSR